ncbi:hypothetical protein PPERSA_02952 [Pseudocohnilembus persalinus]|uniref:Uncharacterized protein n=1 Tax=Pseudocohnilembus persalinus TaxID=266149 RepID=A0A0V0QAB7_PSEPJ|nr:hypothetical protein PPERSA_02952 [Pseudocohnilembus persalinus]|eukprot:KRW99120.1 hypothetical protein PPERSA_02952 [Pseudocohnilembus persalinus]
METDSEFLELQKQLEERDERIEELESQIRLQEHDFKKKEIQINNELANKEQQLESLQKIMKETSQIEKLKMMADDMAQKLAKAEEELLESKNRERASQKELLSMERECMDLKSQLNSRKFQTPDNQQNQNLINNNSNNKNVKIQPFNNGNQQIESIQEDEYEDVDKGELIALLMNLTKEKEELEENAKKIKEGAIDAIMEKEKQILDLEDKLQTLDNQVRENNGGASEIDHLVSQLDIQENENEKLRLEFENYRHEAENEQNYLTEQLKHYQQRLDQEVQQNEEMIYKLEKEIQERQFQNLKETENNQKLVENQFVKEIENLKIHNKKISKTIEENDKKFAKKLQEKQAALENSQKKKEFDQFKSPRTTIKLQFHEYQKDIKNLKDERRTQDQ